MSDPPSWQMQLERRIGTLAELEARLTVTARERAWFEQRSGWTLPFAVTPYVLELMDPTDPTDPIRRQFIPVADEHARGAGQLIDPLGEEQYEVAPHLVRRYPDRALLLATDQCSSYCRHCTRRRRVGRGGSRRLEALRPALDWLAAHEEVEEVLLSGGDPLVADDAWLEAILGALRAIPHLGIIRIGTRAPSTLPMRIDDELCGLLRRFAPLFVTSHFNHPRELTPMAVEGLERLADAGIPVANQAVLLRGVNDDSECLAELGRGLLRARARPYYLMQCDAAAGTSHLRASVARGLGIMESLRGTVTGLAIPTYVLDLPAGAGKVPLTASAIEGRDGDDLLLRGLDGQLVRYRDPAS